MTQTKFELKMGGATRAAFGKALVELGREVVEVEGQTVRFVRFRRALDDTRPIRQRPDETNLARVGQAGQISLG